MPRACRHSSFDLRQSAQRQPGPPQSFLPRQAGSHVFFRLPVEVESQLVIQLAFHGVSPEQGTQTIKQVAQHD